MEWTVETLKEYLEAQIVGVERATVVAMAAADRAVTKAEMAAEKRFDSVNEFRNAMKDQQSTFADKIQTDFRLAAIEKKLENMTGHSQGISSTSYVIGQGILILVAIGGLWITLMIHH